MTITLKLTLQGITFDRTSTFTEYKSENEYSIKNINTNLVKDQDMSIIYHHRNHYLIF